MYLGVCSLFKCLKLLHILGFPLFYRWVPVQDVLGYDSNTIFLLI